MLRNETPPNNDQLDSGDKINMKQTIDCNELLMMNGLSWYSTSDNQSYFKVNFLNREFYIKHDFSEDATLGYAKDLTIIHWSKSAEKLLGYTENEILGKSMQLLVPEDKLSEIMILFNKLEHGEKIQSYQTVRRHKNGRLIPVVIAVTPLFNTNGELYIVFVQYRDISEKKKILEQLASDEEILRNAIEGGRFGVWEWNRDRDMLRFHNDWFKTIGLPDIESEMQLEEWLQFAHTDDMTDLLEMISYAKQGKEYVCEFRMLAKNGRYVWIRGKGKVTEWDDKGKPIKMIGTNEDITDRKWIEEQLAEKCRQLEASQKEAERANHAKTKFLSGISHEIRTPMNGILGILQLLRRTKLDQKQQRWLNMLQEAVDSQMSIIDNMLDITTIESGKIELENHLFNVKLLTTEVYDQLSVLCRPKRLEAKLEFDSNIQHMVYGDKLRVKQILLNLINNAVKFTDHGSITLAVNLRGSDDYTEDIEFRIIDTGIGISLQDRDKIFESYYQGDISSKKKHMGTGLGLAISKQLALLMDGDIKVESEPDVGSAFHFNLRFSKYKKSVSPKDEKDEQEPSEIQYDLTYPTHNRNKVRDEILLSVEDNEINQEIIEEVVKSCGFHLLTAGSGEEALMLIEKYQVDIILMDIQMPGMNGYELTRIIRQIDRFKDIPIIAMSASAKEENQSRCLEAGMNDYIAKPIIIKALDRVLSKYVD